MTKARIKSYREQYQKMGVRYPRVCDVYERPSQANKRAEEAILLEMWRKSGYGYRVITHNAQMFTCGYEYVTDFGDILFVIHTPTERVLVRVGHDWQYTEVCDPI